MSVAKIHAGSELAAACELRTAMQGRVVLHGDDDYARTRQIWNGGVQNQPVLFAVCETSADIQAAVRIARGHRVSVNSRFGSLV